jgi:voltage-gated sodium channel
MARDEMKQLEKMSGISHGRLRLARWLEHPTTQAWVVAIIILNALVLGLETSPAIMERAGGMLRLIDKACLAFFIAELALRLFAWRGAFWRSGWNVFDLAVVAIALVPAAGPWSILRALRVLRVLRLLTVIPALRKVVAAFLHSIPGLLGVIAVMAIFFYTAAVLATTLFGTTHPDWFGNVGRSLYTLFQVMTLESWSMGIVRPVMEQHPFAWAFFVPFIVIATFTILNLFIGIIVSAMQELSSLPDPLPPGEAADTREILERLEATLAELRHQLDKSAKP